MPPAGRSDDRDDLGRASSGPALLVTGPLAIVSDLRAHAARRLSAL